MIGAERRAAAVAVAAAVNEISTTVEDAGAVVRTAVRSGLRPLGLAADGPLASVALTDRAVHRIIRATSTAAGEITGWALELAADDSAVSAAESSPVALSALSAAFGDRLDGHPRTRPLTTSMSFMADGRPVAVEDLPEPAATVCVFVHGLGCTELQWSDAYATVVSETGGTPLRVRYNTGRAIADNGSDLAALLDRLAARWPLQRLVIVGHSMGGLVALSAFGEPSPWQTLVSDVVTLGTPHDGAPLERWAARGLALGTRVDGLAPLLRLGQLRSRGIKDLRFGALTAADWPHADIDQVLFDSRVGVRLPEHVQHTAVIGTLGPTPDHPLGDGMVPTASARGPAHDIVHVGGCAHLRLLDHDEVLDVISGVLARPS